MQRLPWQTLSSAFHRRSTGCTLRSVRRLGWRHLASQAEAAQPASTGEQPAEAASASQQGEATSAEAEATSKKKTKVGSKHAKGSTSAHAKAMPFQWLQQTPTFMFYSTQDVQEGAPAEEFPEIRPHAKTNSCSLVLRPEAHRQSPATVLVLPGHGEPCGVYLETMSWLSQRAPHVKFVVLSPPTPSVRDIFDEYQRRDPSWFCEDAHLYGMYYNEHGSTPNTPSRPGEGEDDAGPQELRASVDLLHAVMMDEIDGGVPVDRIALLGLGQGGAVALQTGLTLPSRFGLPERAQGADEVVGTKGEGGVGAGHAVDATEADVTARDASASVDGSATASCPVDVNEDEKPGHPLAGILTVGGYLASFQRLPTTERGQRTPVQLFQGEPDVSVDVGYAQELASALSEGGLDVKLSIFDLEDGHVFSPEMAEGIRDWIDDTLPAEQQHAPIEDSAAV